MRTQTFKHSLAIAALLSIAFLFAAEVRAELFQKTLSNGLKVIVKEDHRAPVIVQQIWYHVGSMDENVGVTGIAHALEHMMFKGTKTCQLANSQNAYLPRVGVKMLSPATTTPHTFNNYTNPNLLSRCSLNLIACNI